MEVNGKRSFHWASEDAEEWPTEGWQVLTAPPPIDKHERLMSANNW